MCIAIDFNSNSYGCCVERYLQDLSSHRRTNDDFQLSCVSPSSPMTNGEIIKTWAYLINCSSMNTLRGGGGAEVEGKKRTTSQFDGWVKKMKMFSLDIDTKMYETEHEKSESKSLFHLLILLVRSVYVVCEKTNCATTTQMKMWVVV